MCLPAAIIEDFISAADRTGCQVMIFRTYRVHCKILSLKHLRNFCEGFPWLDRAAMHCGVGGGW